MYFVESEAKRKSEEPLVKLFIVDETKRDELAVGESESRKDVVEENKNKLTRSQARVYLNKRHLLVHGVQGRHQKVTLFPIFGLEDCVRGAGVICP